MHASVGICSVEVKPHSGHVISQRSIKSEDICVTSNGEVEGPDDRASQGAAGPQFHLGPRRPSAADQAPRAHNSPAPEAPSKKRIRDPSSDC